MSKFDPFYEVNSEFGAPMGRSGASAVCPTAGKIVARHSGGSEGYDKGGAYWGTPQNVWAVWNHGKGGETVAYVRASSRKGAISIAQVSLLIEGVTA